MPSLNRLEIIVLAPVVAFLFVAGAGLYFLISNSVDDFARRSIEENLQALARAAYEEADDEIDRCDIRGLDCLQGVQKKIHQMAVFERYEDFAREHEIRLIVEVDGVADFVTGLAETELDGSYLQDIEFLPWEWRILLEKNTTAFDDLIADVRRIYVGAGLLLLVITLALVVWLRQTLVRPIYRIAGDFGEGRAPGYQGVRELEYLSDSIGGMMESLQAKTLHLETTLQSMSDGITVFDADMRLVAWNEHFTRLYRYPPEMMRPGVSFEEFMRYNIDRGDYGPCDPEARLAALVERARRMKPPRFEVDHADGSTMEVRRAPMPGGGFVTTYTDVTDRKQAQLLEIASEAKSEFLKNMSHDLRKPITAILQDVRLLLDDHEIDIGAQRHNLETVEDNSQHLLGMVDELLEMSRIEAGQVEVKPEVLAIETVVARVRRVVEPVARTKGLRVEIEDMDGLQASTDPGLLTRILMNLAGNAVENTCEGSITIGAQSLGDSLAISVADTGIGIPGDKIDIIFDKFQQVESSAGIAKPGVGLGLGLAIGQEFAHLLGGGITVESEPGKGSVFIVSIPLEYHER